MDISVPLFKIVQRPLLPVEGSWIDATPFIAMLALLGAAAYFAYGAKRVQLARRSVQFASFFFFIIFIHRCLCTLRGWALGLQTMGHNNLISFGHMCMFIALVAMTVAYGRLFCGWVCPLGLMQELLSKPAKLRMGLLLRERRVWSGLVLLGGITIAVAWFAYQVRPGTQFFVENMAAIWSFALVATLFLVLARDGRDQSLRHLRYVSAGSWLLFSAAGIFVTNPWCVLFGDELDYSSLIAFLAVMATALVVPSAWCRYVCPAGGGLALLSKLSPFQLKNSRACKQCGKCSHLCPTGALAPGTIDRSACIYCARCVGQCGFEWEKPPRQ